MLQMGLHYPAEQNLQAILHLIAVLLTKGCSRAGTAPGTQGQGNWGGRTPQSQCGGSRPPCSPRQGVQASMAPTVPSNRVFLWAHSLLAADTHRVLRVQDTSNYILFIQG